MLVSCATDRPTAAISHRRDPDSHASDREAAGDNSPFWFAGGTCHCSRRIHWALLYS